MTKANLSPFYLKEIDIQIFDGSMICSFRQKVTFKVFQLLCILGLANVPTAVLGMPGCTGVSQ